MWRLIWAHLNLPARSRNIARPPSLGGGLPDRVSGCLVSEHLGQQARNITSGVEIRVCRLKRPPMSLRSP